MIRRVIAIVLAVQVSAWGVMVKVARVSAWLH
jgi:hypothetical protein